MMDPSRRSQKGSIADTLKQARKDIGSDAKHAFPVAAKASLANPTRPFTPLTSQRTGEAAWSTRPETPAYSPVLSSSALQTIIARTGRASPAAVAPAGPGPASPDPLSNCKARPGSGHSEAARSSLSLSLSRSRSRGSTASSTASRASPRDPPDTADTPCHPTPREAGRPAPAAPSRLSPDPQRGLTAPQHQESDSIADQAAALARTIRGGRTLSTQDAAAGEAIIRQFNALSRQAASPALPDHPSRPKPELVAAASSVSDLCAAILHALNAPAHGQVLYRAVKLLFGMSRDPSLDKLVSPCLDPLAAMLESREALGLQTVGFVVSLLKNLSADGPSRELLQRSRILFALAGLCSEAGLARSAGAGAPAELLRVLAEVVEIVRNFAASKQFTAVLECPRLLRALLDLYCHQLGELTAPIPGEQTPPALRTVCLLAVARVVSKLSSHSSARRTLRDEGPFLRAAVDTVRRRIGDEDLTLRLLFMLGNLTVDDEGVRSLLAWQCECAGVVLSMVSEQALSPVSPSDPQLIVKCVRLVANLAISPDISAQIAQDERCLALPMLLERFKEDESAEELTLNVVAAITNLSVRDLLLPRAAPSESDERNWLLRTDTALRVAAEAAPLLFSPNAELVVEALRCLGNYSAEGVVRRALLTLHVPAVLALLLDHADPAVTFAATGVMLNFLSDTEVSEFILDANPTLWLSAVQNLRRCADQLDRLPWILVGQLTVRCLLNIRLARSGEGWLGPADIDSAAQRDLRAQLIEALDCLAVPSPADTPGPERSELARLSSELLGAL